MPERPDLMPLTICLLSDDAVVAGALRVNCPPPQRVDVVSLDGVVDARNTLSEAGRQVVEAAGGYDLILLDWDLERAPVINTFCYHVRQAVRVPLVALCRGGEEAHVAALAAGADDALAFPFGVALLQAKRTAYRRLVEAAGGPPEAEPGAVHDVLRLGSLRLDRTAHTCVVGEQKVDLTFREFTLLHFFLQNAGAACTRDQILDHVWGIQFDTGTNMVDVYVYFLRKKLAAHGFEGAIQTVRGYGYRLARPDEPTA